MRFDLMAGTAAAPLAPFTRAPVVLVFDSGLGGLTVLAEVRRARPDARLVYAADDAAFPYGALPEDVVLSRVLAVMERLIALHAPDLVVIACNTMTTLVLPALRGRFAVPFVGTVPAIKPAATATRSGLVSVLATPGTVRREYTRDLIETYAGTCAVTLVGATGSPPSRRRSCRACRSPTRTSSPRSPPASSRRRRGGPTWWCWAARIIRCCSPATSASPPGR